jgi:hypothetical protein
MSGPEPTVTRSRFADQYTYRSRFSPTLTAQLMNIFFSFPSPEEKSRLTQLIRSNQELGNEYIENDPTVEEIQDVCDPGLKELREHSLRLPTLFSSKNVVFFLAIPFKAREILPHALKASALI